MKLNLEQASREFGCSKETLRRGLVEAGEATGRGAKYSIKTIHHVLAPAIKIERARLLKADADIREMERKQKAGDLVEMVEVVKLITECFLPVRQMLLALPAEACAKCNPTDPPFAMAALQQWVDQKLPLIAGSVR